MSTKEFSKRSEIWNFFEVKAKSDKIAICTMCKVELSYKSTSNNLRKHIQRKHPLVKLNVKRSDGNIDTGENELMEVDDSNNESNLKSNDPAESEPSTSKRKDDTIVQMPKISKTHQTTVSGFLTRKMGVTARKKIDDSLMLLFTRDFQPFSIVEDYGFKKFVTALNPSYQLPSRKTITNTLLPAEYENVYNKTKEILKSVKAVTLTTDCWTSLTTENYLAVTAHFLTKNFKMKHVLLGCELFGESHTSANLAAAITNIIEEFNLDNKIIIVISDNAANITKAIKDNLRLKHFGCYAHTVNLIAHESLKHASGILKKVKQIVTYFRRSTSAMTKLLEQQRHYKIEPTKRLVQEVITRWNSTFNMIERFVELEEPIRTTMALIKHDLPIISLEEWEFLKELVVILKPLEDITKTMSGENYLTGSSVIVVTDGLLNIYNNLRSNDYSTISNSVINSILDGISSRLGDLESSNSLTLTTFLDPRFKNIAFSGDHVTERVKKALTSLITANIKRSIPVGPSQETKENNVGKFESQKMKSSIWSNFDKKVAVLKPTGTAHSRAIIELQRYLEEPPIPRNEDPLIWWGRNSYNFPYLSAIVQEKFVLVATSVPCERLFSKSGLILSDRRNRLSSNKVKKILFLNSNSD